MTRSKTQHVKSKQPASNELRGVKDTHGWTNKVHTRMSTANTSPLAGTSQFLFSGFSLLRFQSCFLHPIEVMLHQVRALV